MFDRDVPAAGCPRVAQRADDATADVAPGAVVPWDPRLALRDAFLRLNFRIGVVRAFLHRDEEMRDGPVLFAPSENHCQWHSLAQVLYAGEVAASWASGWWDGCWGIARGRRGRRRCWRRRPRHRLFRTFRGFLRSDTLLHATNETATTFLAHGRTELNEKFATVIRIQV